MLRVDSPFTISWLRNCLNFC